MSGAIDHFPSLREVRRRRDDPAVDARDQPRAAVAVSACGRPDREVDMKSLTFTTIILLGITCATSFAADPAQIAVKGPYEIGFTSFMLMDASRAGDGAQYLERPIPVYVWYPVDPSTIDGSTPEALYPLDPLYDQVPVTTSSHWELYGMDRAYHEPAPSQTGPFPLVMVSPGWGMMPWVHTSIGTRLASHGFVVAVLYHAGDQFWSWEPPFDHIALACWNRPRDVSYALTDLLARNVEPGDLFHGLIHPDRIAASGWSLGGYASMVLAAGDDSVCDVFQGDDWVEWFGPPPPETCTPSLPDPRIKAIVPLDGSNQCLWFTELARVQIPAMGIGEEWDTLALDPGWESWQARQHAAFRGHPSYRVDVWGANHQSFSDMCEGLHVMLDVGIDTLWEPGDVYDWLAWLCEDVTPAADVHRLVNQYMIAFLTSTVLGRNDYRSMLTPGYALQQPLIEFFVTEKRSPNAIHDDWPDEFIYFKHQPGNQTARGPKNATAALRVFRPGPVQVGKARPAPAPAAAVAGLDLQAGPNPFNPGTTVAYSLPVGGSVCLQLFDLRGRLVRVLVAEVQAAGSHAAQWDGRDDDGREQPSGVYLARIEAGGQAMVRRLTLVR
jgi:predicted dienelactone hydrolase